jgi:cell wall-associated NlpC family hydrolase
LRPIRLLILLLAIALAVTLALLRPLQGRATRPSKRPHTHQTRHVHLRKHHGRPHHQPRHRHHRADATSRFGHRVVAYARRFLGIRYSWGGTSPRTGFDCSGLVRYVYGHFGISLPHSSFADLGLGRRVPRRWLRPGDIVFFAGASHVGIYAGSGRFIDAPHSGAVVRITTMHGWYGDSYYGARRLAARGG